MNNNPLISIVVLNFNGLEYLKKTIPPLLNLNYPNYEIIVVDNASSDESLEYLQQYDKIMIILNKNNLGYSKGKNIGVKEARGEYILLLDEDTLINNENILNELSALYNKLPNIGFLGILSREREDNIHTKLYGGFISWFSVYRDKKIKINNLMKIDYHRAASPEGLAIFFRRKLFLDLHGFDISQPYYIDVGDIGLRASTNGYNTYIYDKVIFCHLGKARKTNIKGWAWKYGYYFSGLSRVILKNYRLKNLIIAFPLFFTFCCLKTAINLIRYKHISVLTRFIFSIKLFIINLPDTLKKRKLIHNSRSEKNDSFLSIKPPNIV